MEAECASSAAEAYMMIFLYRFDTKSIHVILTRVLFTRLKWNWV